MSTVHPPSADAHAGAALTLDLGHDLTVVMAAQHHESLTKTLLARTGDLHLDLSAVDEFDSSGVQLLLAARRSLQERGDQLHLLNPSSAVCDALAVFCLQDLLHTEARA